MHVHWAWNAQIRPTPQGSVRAAGLIPSFRRYGQVALASLDTFDLYLAPFAWLQLGEIGDALSPLLVCPFQRLSD